MYQFNSEDLAYAGYIKKGITSNSNDLNVDYPQITVDKIVEAEVLQFCNQFLNDYKLPKTKGNFQKVETFLQHAVLEHETNKEKIADWIASNWIKI
jgi:hypothetical protein